MVMAITHKTVRLCLNGVTDMKTRLRIFVEPGCEGCHRALSLAGAIRDRFPALEVEVVDLSAPEAHRPEYVFAVPTFVLNGRVLSLGNPRPSRLVAAVEAALREGGAPDG
jgi:predicted thioredoxin/glutaredoxin